MHLIILPKIFLSFVAQNILEDSACIVLYILLVGASSVDASLQEYYSHCLAYCTFFKIIFLSAGQNISPAAYLYVRSTNSAENQPTG